MKIFSTILDFCHIVVKRECGENPMEDMSEMFFSSFMSQNEEDQEQDLSYMKSLYPVQVRKINESIEEECDKLEFEGSLMLAEYPDRVTIERLAQNIYKANLGEEEFEASDCFRPCPTCPCSNDNPMYQMIQVMLLNEMYVRRRRYRRRMCMFC